VSGYPGGNEISLAMERREVDGHCGLAWGSAKGRLSDWLKTGKLNMLTQFALTRAPDLPDVPTAIELAGDDETREMLRLFAIKFTAAYPVALPPDVPADRRDMLRAAFVATTKDPAFLADLAKLNIPPGAVSAQEVEDLLRGAAQVSPALVDRLRGVLTVE